MRKVANNMENKIHSTITLLTLATLTLVAVSCSNLLKNGDENLKDTALVRVIFTVVTPETEVNSAKTTMSRAASISDVGFMELEALQSGSTIPEHFFIEYDSSTGKFRSRTLMFAPGSWTFTARAFDNTKNLIFEGSTQATLVAGEETPLSIILFEVAGNPEAYILDLSFGRTLKPVEFVSLSGIAWAPDNTLYVVDPDNHWIQVFDQAGTTPAFRDTIGASNDWTFNTAHQISLAKDGSLWIADRPSNAIRHAWRDTDSHWIVDEELTEYMDGANSYTFTNPSGIAVSGTGSDFKMFIANTDKQEVLELDENFMLSKKWTTVTVDDPTNSSSRPFSLALWVDPADSATYVFLTDPGTGLVKKFTTEGVFVSSTANYTSFHEYRGIAVATDGHVYVSDRKYKSSEAYGAIHVFGPDLTPMFNRCLYGSAEGELNDISGLALSPDGTMLAVADSGNHRVQILSIDLTNSNLNFKSSTGTAYDPSDQYCQPLGATYDSTGNLYILDRIQNRIKKYDSDGCYVTSWGKTEPKAVGYATNITSRKIDGTDYIFTMDGDVCAYTTEGTFLTRFNVQVFTTPTVWNLNWFKETFYIDTDGNFVIGRNNAQGLYKVNAQVDDTPWTTQPVENPLLLWEKQGVGAIGNLTSFEGTAPGPDGSILVIDRKNKLGAVLNPNGEVLQEIDGNGSEEGQFREPTAITTDSEGNIYIADWGNRRINKYDSEMEFLCTIGTGHVTSEPTALAVRGDGSELILVSRNAPFIQRFIRH